MLATSCRDLKGRDKDVEACPNDMEQEQGILAKHGPNVVVYVVSDLHQHHSQTQLDTITTNTSTVCGSIRRGVEDLKNSKGVEDVVACEACKGCQVQ